jgi:hypothetical protein
MGLEMTEAPFKNYHSKAYVCIHVALRQRPILLVDHTNGVWQFLCGSSHEPSECRVVGVGHLFDFDSSLIELLDLPDGTEANRVDANSPWIRGPSQ